MRSRGNLWKGIGAGMVGGLVASWVMNQFQSWWSQHSYGVERSHGAQSLQQGSPRQGSLQQQWGQNPTEEPSDDATERLAAAISEEVAERTLTKREKAATGTVIHYAFGTAAGAFYGAAAEFIPSLTTGAGVPFGAFFWLTTDEGVIPLLGLSKTPDEYPLNIHVYALASHVVYGVTAELVRQTVRRSL